MRIGEVCGVYGAKIVNGFRNYIMESNDERFNTMCHHRLTRVLNSGSGQLERDISSKSSWIAVKSQDGIFVMPPDAVLEKSKLLDMFRSFNVEPQALVFFILDTNEFHNEIGSAASLAEFNEIRAISFLQKSFAKRLVLNYEEAEKITVDAFKMFSGYSKPTDLKPCVLHWKKPKVSKRSISNEIKCVKTEVGDRRETQIWSDGWDTQLHSQFSLSKWIVVQGKDSVCVVTLGDVSKRFLKVLSYHLQVYPLFGRRHFVSQSSLKRSFLTTPFAIVSVQEQVGGLNKASIAEINAVEFLGEQIKKVPSFTLEVTVQTAIDAFICLAQNDINKKGIQVHVWRNGKLPFKERILFKDNSRVDEIVMRLQKKMKFCQHKHGHDEFVIFLQEKMKFRQHIYGRAEISYHQIEDFATDEEESRLMDLMQDDLNFKRNLVHKNTFRMGNKSDRMVVVFRNLKAIKDFFYLEFGKHDPFDVVVARVAQKLGVYKVRLTQHNCYCNKPHSDYHIESLFGGCLVDLFYVPDKICNVLYYEVLDDPQVDLAHSIKLNVSYGYPYQETSVVLSRQNRVQDLLDNIKPKMKLSNSDAELTLLGIYNHKIIKFFHVEEKIVDISDDTHLWVKEVLEEEKNLDRCHHLISVYHFTEMVNGVIVRFGEPFLFVIHDNETLAEVKFRIRKQLSLENDEDFSKWRFTPLCLGERLQYLEDSDVVYNCFEREKDILQLYLGLEHHKKYEEDDLYDFIITPMAMDNISDVGESDDEF